jgi:hypothetical protein
MFFGKDARICSPVTLDNLTLSLVEVWPYLGVDVSSGPCFSCSIKSKLSKFYRSVNSILRVDGLCNGMALLRLIESHSLPILTYAIEIVHVRDAAERRQLRVAYNCIFRRIFHMRKFDSVSELQTLLNKPTWEQLVDKRVQSFNASLKMSENPLIYVCTIA